jgi:hypothetical protein
MTVMDNGRGGFGTRANTPDRSNALIEVTENNILGESAIPDCPDASNGDYCIKIDKVAMVPGGFGGGKDLHPTSPSKFPYWKVNAHNWAGLTHFTNNKISDFGGKTMYDMKSVVLGSVPWDSDITQPNYFYAITLLTSPKIPLLYLHLHRPDGPMAKIAVISHAQLPTMF